MNIPPATPALQFKSYPRLLKQFSVIGGIFYCTLTLFLLTPRSFNLPKPEQIELTDFIGFLFISLLWTGVLALLVYSPYLLLNAPSLSINQQGLTIDKRAKTIFLTWDEIEKLTVVTMEIRAKSVFYTGQKMLIIARGKHLGTITSFDIGNFDKLIQYLTVAKKTLPAKIFIPRQFQEKTLLTYVYAASFWLILIMMASSIFLSIDSKYYIFN